MLVLTRKAEEKIKIGENITVSILSIDGGVVKLGIDAPRDVTILRMEVLEQIQKENIDAAAKDVADISEVVDILKGKLSNKQNGQKEQGDQKD